MTMAPDEVYDNENICSSNEGAIFCGLCKRPFSNRGDELNEGKITYGIFGYTISMACHQPPTKKICPACVKKILSLVKE